MKNLKLIILLFFVSLIALLLETTVINFPLVFFLACILIFFIKKIPAFIAALILCFIIDSLRVSNFGLTAIFLFATLLFVILYEKFSGSDDIAMKTLIIGIATFLYAHFLSYSVFLVFLMFLVIIVCWYIFDLLQKKGKIYI